MSDMDRIADEWHAQDRESAAMWARVRKSLWAWGSGVGTMLLAVKLRDKGMDAVDAWFVMGFVGNIAMFGASTARPS